ncbi:MAG: DUF6088 family protein [Planctomycetota bacterium]
MSTGVPRLRRGRVYRTRDLEPFGKNTTRLATRLVRDGVLVKLANGLYHRPRVGKFGPVPPTDEELMRAFLDGTPYVFTGPERWNALGLGSTAMFPARLVYNTKRSCEVTLGGKRFLLRRVRFPVRPSPEWFAVDLLENHRMAGVSREALEANLITALEAERLDAETLRSMALEYGTRSTQALVTRVILATRAAE